MSFVDNTLATVAVGIALALSVFVHLKKCMRYNENSIVLLILLKCSKDQSNTFENFHSISYF